MSSYAIMRTKPARFSSKMSSLFSGSWIQATGAVIQVHGYFYLKLHIISNYVSIPSYYIYV